jgi:hypothetical protein
LAVLAGCFTVFGVVYVLTTLLLRVPTSDERERVRQGFERLQRVVYPGRSAV